MFDIFLQLICVWRPLIHVNMEVPARQPVTGHTLHAIVLPGILVMIADISKVIHNIIGKFVT